MEEQFERLKFKAFNPVTNLYEWIPAAITLGAKLSFLKIQPQALELQGFTFLIPLHMIKTIAQQTPTRFIVFQFDEKQDEFMTTESQSSKQWIKYLEQLQQSATIGSNPPKFDDAVAPSLLSPRGEPLIFSPARSEKEVSFQRLQDRCNDIKAELLDILHKKTQAPAVEEKEAIRCEQEAPELNPPVGISSCVGPPAPSVAVRKPDSSASSDMSTPESSASHKSKPVCILRKRPKSQTKDRVKVRSVRKKATKTASSKAAILRPGKPSTRIALRLGKTRDSTPQSWTKPELKLDPGRPAKSQSLKQVKPMVVSSSTQTIIKSVKVKQSLLPKSKAPKSKLKATPSKVLKKDLTDAATQTLRVKQERVLKKPKKPTTCSVGTQIRADAKDESKNEISIGTYLKELEEERKSHKLARKHINELTEKNMEKDKELELLKDRNQQESKDQLDILTRLEKVLKASEREKEISKNRIVELLRNLTEKTDQLRLAQAEKQQLEETNVALVAEQAEWKQNLKEYQQEIKRLRTEIDIVQDEAQLSVQESSRLNQQKKALMQDVKRLDQLVYGRF